MTNSTKICPNKDCRKELQPEDQYCASCGTRVPESPAFDRKYVLAVGLGFFIIGIVAGGYISINFLPDSNASEPMNLSDAYMLKTLGDKNKTKDNIEDAQIWYSKSIKRNPNLKEAWLAMGDAEYCRKAPNYSNASDYYKNAIKIDCTYYEALMGVGNASLDIAENYYKKGNYKDSIEYYNDSIKYYDEAINSSKIKNIYKRKSAAMRGLATNYNINLSPELRKKATECSNLSIMLNPNDPEPLSTMGEILNFIGEKENSKVYTDRAQILKNPKY